MARTHLTLTVRPATPTDTPAVDAMLARSYPRLLRADYPPSVLVTAVPLIARARPELLASGTYFVAEEVDGTILGAGGWTVRGPRGADSRGLGHVRHVVTDDRALRRGVGRAIMERVFDTAHAAGVTALACLSTRTAVPFYLALGFRPSAQGSEVAVPLAPGIAFPAVPLIRTL
ncbi:MAG: GNAT family N-acetyltransferase [Rhodobacteraceae bacterium]|jgi:GNAT superfamily N-acetyltransferase|nr:GNAT family N-acetyltransferase [Paracoccaceae bacterium]